MANLAPLVTVVKATSRQYRALFNNQLWGAEWALTLECGHEDTRPVRFPPGHRRGFAALHHPRPLSEALPHPKRIRCIACLKQLDTATEEITYRVQQTPSVVALSIDEGCRPPARKTP